MNKAEFIAHKIPILIKEGYSRAQSAAIAYSMAEKERHKAQQGTMFNQTLPAQPKYVMPNFNQLPDQGYDFNYNNTFNPQPIENNTSFGQFSASNYEIPTQINSTPQSFSEYNQAQNQVEAENRATNPYTTNSVNILPPTQFGNPAYNLKQGMYNFGRGNTLGGIAGTGASLLGMARIGLSGYAEGKEDKRVGREYMDKTFDRTQNYQYGQQGGKIKNSDIIAQNAIIDQGQGNVNLEGGGGNKIGEYVLRTTGQIQPVVGDRHINGEGVDVELNNGDKVVNDSDMKSSKLTAKDAKELKDRFNLSNMKGKTPAKAVTAVGELLGINKLEKEKATVLEQVEKANKIKDINSKQLSLSVLTQKIAGINEKLTTLAEPRKEATQFIFELQERKPKKGDGTQIFDKNGKEVTESKEEVAQQGRTYRTNDQSYGAQRVSNFLNSEDLSSNMGINLRKIKNIQSGVMNDKLGSGYYMYYDKLPTDAGFDPNRNREFVTEEAYKNTVMRTPAYQEYMRGLAAPRTNQLAELQQGGEIEVLAKKHGISVQRAQELMSFQQGGIQSQQEETQEGQASNAQEERGEISPEQIVSAFAELSQQDPQQIIAQLQKMSPEEQQQALGQMMQALQQGQQNPQEEEMEVAQQGKYMQLAGKYSEKDQKVRLNDFYNMSSGLGYEGKKEIGAMQNWMADNYPDEVVKYFTENGQPLTAKHVDIIKNKYKDAFKETGISANKKSEDYTVEEKLKLQTALGDKANKEFLLEGFKDNKWDWRFPMIGQKPNTSAQGAPQAQITAPSMARFALPQEEVTQETPETAAGQRQEQAAAPSGVRNISSTYGTFLAPTSALEPIPLSTYSPYLYENKKMSTEAMSQEQARQAQTDAERIQQSGMSPQSVEALLGQASAANQMAANDAIYKTETYNADNAWKTDMANVDALNKSQIMNTQYLNDFAQKSAAALANKETERYNNAYSNFLQDQADRKYTDQVNMLNMATSDQYALVPGQGIIALNNKPFEIKPDLKAYEAIRNMTPEEYNAYKKQMALKGTV